NYDESIEQLDTLVEKYLEGKLPEEFYQRKLSELEQTKEVRKKVLDGIDSRVNERIQELDQDLSFAVTACAAFADADDHKRREIIAYLGSNLTLTNHVLDIELKRPLKMVNEIAETVSNAAKAFEPLESVDNSEQFKLFLSENPAMGA
ncbi:MAG: hypothetical protein O2840_02165, partial [bacterium]|nr:hypothetical protein [bacterium]